MKRMLCCLLLLALPASSQALDCVIPRAHYCRFPAGGESPAGDAGVAALRLAVCRGDAETAERLMQMVVAGGLGRGELRFALAGLIRLKGGEAEARMAYRSLQERYPGEGWGDWGLGLVALAEERPGDALAHMQGAAARGGESVEAQTAVLKYLETYWRRQERAPGEEGFLAIFRNLEPVRECFARQAAGPPALAAN